jgi:hypothetical protein
MAPATDERGVRGGEHPRGSWSDAWRVLRSGVISAPRRAISCGLPTQFFVGKKFGDSEHAATTMLRREHNDQTVRNGDCRCCGLTRAPVGQLQTDAQRGARGGICRQIVIPMILEQPFAL